jgi:hypothetical protein
MEESKEPAKLAAEDLRTMLTFMAVTRFAG